MLPGGEPKQPVTALSCLVPSEDTSATARPPPSPAPQSCPEGRGEPGPSRQQLGQARGAEAPPPALTRVDAEVSQPPLAVAEVEAPRGEAEEEALGRGGDAGEGGESGLHVAEAGVGGEAGQRLAAAPGLAAQPQHRARGRPALPPPPPPPPRLAAASASGPFPPPALARSPSAPRHWPRGDAGTRPREGLRPIRAPPSRGRRGGGRARARPPSLGLIRAAGTPPFVTSRGAPSRRPLGPARCAGHLHLICMQRAAGPWRRQRGRAAPCGAAAGPCAAGRNSAVSAGGKGKKGGKREKKGGGKKMEKGEKN